MREGEDVIAYYTCDEKLGNGCKLVVRAIAVGRLAAWYLIGWWWARER